MATSTVVAIRQEVRKSLSETYSQQQHNWPSKYWHFEYPDLTALRAAKLARNRLLIYILVQLLERNYTFVKDYDIKSFSVWNEGRQIKLIPNIYSWKKGFMIKQFPLIIQKKLDFWGKVSHMEEHLIKACDWILIEIRQGNASPPFNLMEVKQYRGHNADWGRFESTLLAQPKPPTDSSNLTEQLWGLWPAALPINPSLR